MNIAYDAAHRIFKLDTDHTSYVIAVIDDHGDTLMRAGINAPGTWGDYQSRLIHIITADK